MKKQNSAFKLVLAFAILFAQSTLSQTINTIAGNGSGSSSGDNGPATAAGLFHPAGAYFEAPNVLYVVEYDGARIRKIAPSGIITNFAGTGVVGFGGDGGPATAAQFKTPIEMVKDHHGNFYITDNGNNRIRKIDTAGIVSTIAGSPTHGYYGDGGPASAALINWPNRITVDASDNVYFTDAVNNVVRKINAAGIITTVVGNGTSGYSGDGGPATDATLSNPLGVAFDVFGNMMIADAANHVIRKVDTNGKIWTIAGNGMPGTGGDGGPATAASMQFPDAVAVDNGCNIYTTDWNDQKVRKITPTGIISTVTGTGTAGYSGDGGPATAAMIHGPDNLVFDLNMDLFIPDFYNNRVRKVLNVGELIGFCGVNVTLGAPKSVPYGDQALSVYPNPSKGYVRLYQQIEEAASYDLTIINIAGQVISKRTVAFTNGSALVDLSRAPAGTYFIKATAPNLRQTLKVVIEQ